MMITALFICLLLSASYQASEVCGPEACGLLCSQGESCVQDTEISCCCEPCCPQWSCESERTASCPPTSPDLGSPCSEEGLHCDYGSQECCGQNYPELSMECAGGAWQGYYVDTLCVLGLAPPCPDESTTTSQGPL